MAQQSNSQFLQKQIKSLHIKTSACFYGHFSLICPASSSEKQMANNPAGKDMSHRCGSL